MLLWMCVVSLWNKIPSAQRREKMGIELVTEGVKMNQLRSLGKVMVRYKVGGVRNQGHV